MRLNAIIGATASGKSALALTLAKKYDYEIFSIDSLSVYKYVNIASAKPSARELLEVRHWGINVLEPYEKCHAGVFYELLQKCAHERLLIVGGSGFYLKSIIDGLSALPKVSQNIASKIAQIAQNADAHALLEKLDSKYAKKIHPNDKYRIQKALEIYFATRMPPSEFFATHARRRLDFEIKIFELDLPREKIKENIIARTDKMFELGLVNEVANLARDFPHSQALKAIGLKEILRYLNGEISLDFARELIIKNTSALAKRQRTFNRTQFGDVFRGNAEAIAREIEAT